MTVPFSRDDLAETAQRIKDRLDGDNETLALLQQLLDMAEQSHDAWDERLADLESSSKAMLKAVALLVKQGQRQATRLESMHKGLVSLYRMTKSQTAVTGKPLTKSLLGKSQPTVTKHEGGMSLDAATRLGTLAKTIQGVFGNNGGHSMAYNAPLASKMIIEGTLTAKQHQVWKRSNRLHDDPYQALQRRKVG